MTVQIASHKFEQTDTLPIVLLTLTVALVHMAIAGLVPVFQDEAYYALWATHLAPDYYDHPPMIAIWIRIGTVLLGQNPAGIRLVSVLGFALVTPLTWDMARTLGVDARRAFAAALFVSVMPLPAALGFTATPDSPSTFFWALDLWLVLRAVTSGRASPLLWSLAGLAAGLGVLSKFTNLFLLVGLFIWFAGSRTGRRSLDGSGPWIMAIAAIATLDPFFEWNAVHDWYGFTRQFSRVLSAHSQGNHVTEYVIVTLLTTIPFLSIPIVRAAWRARGLTQILAATTAPLLLYFLYHALHARIQANWMVPLTPALAVLAALGIKKPGALTNSLIAAFGGGITVLCLTLALWPGRPVFPGDNPANQTKGWSAFTQTLGAIAEQENARWIATVNYGTTGELALHLPELPVWQVTETQRYRFRGPFPHALCDSKGLLVAAVSAGSSLPKTLFRQVGNSIELARFSRSARIGNYVVTQVSGIRHCP